MPPPFKFGQYVYDNPDWDESLVTEEQEVRKELTPPAEPAEEQALETKVPVGC